jgi:S1-C subfamily serine protease
LAAGDERDKKPAAKSKSKAKDRVPALETEAQQCKTAEEALLVYQIFMSDSETTDEEKERARPRLEYWEQAAKDQLVRSGKNWIPREEADKLKAEADKLVAEAIELLDLKSYRKADEKLEKASRICPDHLESLFLLGVGALLSNDVKGAEKRFAQCLNRAPNHVPLLNNTAICATFGKKYDRAVKLWEKAAAADPDNATVAQNVGQFIADATKAKTLTKAERAQNAALIAKAKAQGKVMIDFSTVDRHVLDDATDLYAKIMAGGKVPRATPTGGYVILKLFQEKKEGGQSPEETQIVGNGSGFVIGDGYVLTNRHVVDDADGLALQDPANPTGAPLAGKVLAVSKTLDLAIIACPDLKAPAAPVDSAEVTRGTEVLALGFPVMNVVGKGLKATRGIVTGLPSKDTGNLMVLDVQINPGNSGGPLCDKSGRVIGIVAAKTFTERFIQGYGLAIPMSDALGFVSQSVPKFSPRQADDKKLEWTEVDAQISKSTVLILIKKKRKS